MAMPMCAYCHGGCDFAKYRNFVRDLILTFIKGIIYKDALALKVIEDTSFEIQVSAKHDHMDYDLTKGGFCQHFISETNK
jgi:hypothetical protein